MCSPSSGAGVAASAGVPWSRIGGPTIRMGPAVGWFTVTIAPRARRCSDSSASPTDLIFPAGTPARSSRASHSAAGAARKMPASSGTSTSRRSTRFASVSKRASVASSGWPIPWQKRVQSELLATPTVR